MKKQIIVDVNKMETTTSSLPIPDVNPPQIPIESDVVEKQETGIDEVKNEK